MQSLDTEQLAFLIAAARAFETEDFSVAHEPIGHRDNDGAIDVVEPSHEDGIAFELRSFIDALSDEQQVELVALVWFGRETDGEITWTEALSRAQIAHTSRTANYLLGIPMLAEFIEDGLSRINPALFSAVESRIASHTGA